MIYETWKGGFFFLFSLWPHKLLFFFSDIIGCQKALSAGKQMALLQRLWFRCWSRKSWWSIQQQKKMNINWKYTKLFFFSLSQGGNSICGHWFYHFFMCSCSPAGLFQKQQQQLQVWRKRNFLIHDWSRNANPCLSLYLFIFFWARHQIKFSVGAVHDRARTKAAASTPEEQTSTITETEGDVCPFFLFVYLPPLQTKPITAGD